MTKTKKITIAIDGFSSCGKSTLAKALAKKLIIFLLIAEQCIEVFLCIALTIILPLIMK